MNRPATITAALIRRSAGRLTAPVIGQAVDVAYNTPLRLAKQRSGGETHRPLWVMESIPQQGKRPMKRRIEPGSGQESVWDYPRPPRIEACGKQIEIVTGGITIADTKAAFRVLETSHPPVYYLPPDDIRMDLLRPSSHGSFCEWKGHAHYFSLNVDGQEIPNVAWCYKTPTGRFEAIAGYLAFYPSKMDECWVDGERVQAQAGDFYGGWITSNIVGPFKGGLGSQGW